jgi:hypothetical protein
MTRIRLADVPAAPAYLVFHDAFDGGAMDVYLKQDFAAAEIQATNNNQRLDAEGVDNCGFWKAYSKLPRKRIYALHCFPEVAR